MKKIAVYGSGCRKCKKLLEHVEEAIRGKEDLFSVEYISDIDRIVAAGILVTPALVIDGEKAVSGQVVSVKTVKTLLGLS